ncbi:7524_t:CDS:2, partial [Paraglomus occultum]
VLFGMKASRVNSLRALNYAHFLVFSLYITSWLFASTASLFLAVLAMTPTFNIISDLSSSTVWYTDSQGASQVIQTNGLAGQDESIVLARQERSLYSTMCHLSILLCVFMYTSAKLMLYLFLAERVHIVRDSRIARKDSFLYRVNMLLLIPYAGITAGMYIQRITRFAPAADQCEIGVELPTLLVLLSYDTAVSIYLTVLFIQPLVRVNYKNQHRFLY